MQPYHDWVMHGLFSDDKAAGDVLSLPALSEILACFQKATLLTLLSDASPRPHHCVVLHHLCR